MVATTTVTHGTRRQRSWALAAQPLIDWTAEVARDVLQEEQSRGRFPRNEREYVTRVVTKAGPRVGHGREGQVKLGGQIWYTRWGMDTDWIPGALEIIRLVMQQVPFTAKPANKNLRGFRRSHYAHRFVLLRNNQIVVPPGANFGVRASRWLERNAQTADAGTQFAVTNIMPYARRIDKGAPGHTPWSSQAPRGVLSRAFSAAKSRKKTKNLFLDYAMRPLPGGIPEREVSSQGALVTYADRRRVKRKGWVYSGKIMRKHRVYPVLYFGPPAQGDSSISAQPRSPWTHRESSYEVLGHGGIISGSVTGRAAGMRRGQGVRVDIRTR